MKIRYTVDIEDMVAYHQYFCSNSPFACKIRGKSIIVASAVAVVVYGLLMLAMGKSIMDIIIGGVVFFAVSWLVFTRIVPFLNRNTGIQQIQQVYSSDPNKKKLGMREIEILQDLIKEMANGNISSVNIRKIEHIEETSTHVFLFKKFNAAYVIPKAKVIEGELDTFVAALQERVQ